MKIQNDAGNSALPIRGETAAAKVSSKVAASGGQPPPDELSEDRVETSAIGGQLQASPARLEQLRAAVQNGTYSTPAREISAKLIEAHLDGGL